MKYLSLFSGIEAASVAWHDLGWTPAGFSEIDPFAASVLSARQNATAPRFMPDPDEAQTKSDKTARRNAINQIRQLSGGTIPNWGDITKYKDWPASCLCDTYDSNEPVCGTCRGLRIELIVGGSPCQAFSIAGLRKGLDDPRGNLMLTFGAVVRRYLPRWVLWENVAGVLSSNAGRDFATFLGLITGTNVRPPRDGWRNSGVIQGYSGAYGVAWRVLDTQFTRTSRFPMAIPQRRRRVFVVGYLGDWRRAAAVLFDAESLSGNPPPRREAGQGFAPAPESGSGERGWSDPSDGNGGGLICADKGPGHNRDHNFVATYRIDSEASNSMKSSNPHSGFVECDVSKTIDTGGTDPNKAQGGNVVLTVFENHPQDSRITETDGVGPTVDARYGTGGGNVPLVLEGKGLVAARMVAFGEYEEDGTASTDATDLVAHTLRGEGFDASEDGTGRGTPLAKDSGADAVSSAVRRLTPIECERLQGFPDDYTKIAWAKTADKCPDGRRYKALGNSMSTNVMEWIGRRIQMVEEQYEIFNRPVETE